MHLATPDGTGDGFIAENRHSLEREHIWIRRNEDRIRILATHADSFLEELHSRPREEPQTLAVGR